MDDMKTPNTYATAARGWSRELQRDLDAAMARVEELKLIREKAVGGLVELMITLDVRKLTPPAAPSVVLPITADYRAAAEALVNHADAVRDLLKPFDSGVRADRTQT